MSNNVLPSPKLSGGPYLMGVLNVTPDSFSDGGRFTGAQAVRHALDMLDAGADIVDIGGESTRPGAEPVAERAEIERVVPIIRGIRAESDAAISIDTMKPAVALAAFAAGATIWNDVLALRAPGALETAASLGAPVIVMHMRGDPRTMQSDPSYDDVVGEVILFLRARVDAASQRGVRDIWVDPGIGFGKTLTHNLALINAVGRIGAEIGKPVIIGASRKSFIGRIDPQSEPAGRVGGSIAAALIAAQNGAAMLRVHDVRETAQALRVWRAAQG